MTAIRAMADDAPVARIPRVARSASQSASAKDTSTLSTVAMTTRPASASPISARGEPCPADRAMATELVLTVMCLISTGRWAIPNAASGTAPRKEPERRVAEKSAPRAP